MAITRLPSGNTLLELSSGGETSLEDRCKALLEQGDACLVVISGSDKAALPRSALYNLPLCMAQQYETGPEGI